MPRPRQPRAGRNLGRFSDGTTTYRVRSVNQQLQFRPLHGRENSVIRVALADVLEHFAAGSLFHTGEAVFRAWVQDGELRFRRLNQDQSGELVLPLSAALELARKQLFIPT